MCALAFSAKRARGPACRKIDAIYLTLMAQHWPPDGRDGTVLPFVVTLENKAVAVMLSANTARSGHDQRL